MVEIAVGANFWKALFEGVKVCARYARELVRAEEIHVETP